MLDVFLLIFVADTKTSFRYDFVAPLKNMTIRKLSFFSRLNMTTVGREFCSK